jgi:glutamine synthetase
MVPPADSTVNSAFYEVDSVAHPRRGRASRRRQPVDQLEKDHEYLSEAGVFTPDLIETWITLKRDTEIAPLSTRPQPMEFELYFDC